MPTFTYKAKKSPKKTIVNEIRAEDVNSALSKLKKEGLFPIFIEKKKEGFHHTSLLNLKNINSQDINVFIRGLSSLLHSGLPLAKALNSLNRQTNHKRLKSVIEDIELRIQKGETFYSALGRYPKIFSPFFISIVIAGEKGGMLDDALARLSESRERDQNLKNQIKAALSYPVLLVTVSLATIFVLLTFIIPKFVLMFEELSQTLPLPTRMLLGLSNFFSHWWPALLVVIIAGVVSIKRYVSSERGALWADKLKLKLPFLGVIFNNIEIARFTRTLATLLKNGLPVLQALHVASETVNSKVFAKETKRFYQGIEKGKRLSVLMEEGKVFPASVSELVAVGEEGAELERILLEVSQSFEKETEARIKTFMSILEPALILILGAVVAFIVVSMLLPIFEIDMFLV